MKNLKKAIVLILSLVVIIAFANFSLASTITTKNETENGTNEVENNTIDNNTIENNTLNNTSGSLTTNNTPKTINTSNSTENLPNTGIDSSEVNLALIVLLALVFCMFSLVQYNKIVKKDNE